MEVTRTNNHRYLQYTMGGTSNNLMLLLRSGKKNHVSLGKFTQEKSTLVGRSTEKSCWVDERKGVTI